MQQAMIDTDLSTELRQYLGLGGLEVLLGLAEVVEIPAGGRLTTDGQGVDSLYLVLDGVFDVSIQEGGQSIRLGRVGRGKWLGEVSLFSGHHQASASLTAESTGKVLKLRHSDFQALQREHLEVAGNLTRMMIGTLVERLRKSVDTPILVGAASYSVAGSEDIQQIQHKQGLTGRLMALIQKVLGVEGGKR